LYVFVLTAAGLLAAMSLASKSSADGPAKAGDVTEARVLQETSEGNNWMVDGGDFGERHFSSLKEIPTKTSTRWGWHGG